LYKNIDDTYTIESAYWPVLDRRTRKVPSGRPFRIRSASEREPFKNSHVFSSEWTAKSTSSLFCFISFFFNHLQCSNELVQFFNVKIKGNFWQQTEYYKRIRTENGDPFVAQVLQSLTSACTFLSQGFYSRRSVVSDFHPIVLCYLLRPLVFASTILNCLLNCF